MSPAQPTVERVKFDRYGNAKGSIKTTATHPVSLKGYVITSRGRVTTEVRQNISFSNVQKINVTSSRYAQNIVQTTTIASTSQTTSAGRTLKTQSQWAYPLNMKYNYVAASGGASQTTDILQTKSGSGLDQTRKRADSWSLLDTVTSSDILHFSGGGFSPSNGKSRQQYKSLNLDGSCYEKTIKSRNYVVTGSTKGC
jgi:hypothetical protein